VGGKLHRRNAEKRDVRVIATSMPALSFRARMPQVGFAMALLLAATLLAGCHRAPAEQQIHDAIEAAATAARANDTSGVLDVVSDDFTGNEGDLDQRGLRRLLAVRAFRQDKTGILIGPITFDRKGDRVIAHFNLVLTGGRQGDLLPDQSAVYAMATAWRREGGEWRCYNATWTSAGR
jgi:ketosteroid isomerase-like protein